MIGGVVAVLICVWFYRTAIRLNLNVVQWIVGALIVYYGIKAIWMYGILKPLMGGSYRYYTATAGVLMEVSGALLGALGAVLFRNLVMLKKAR
ncbi:hypothetical protein [Methylocaldum szegediense]|jgi:hypothetical protein|uniref:Uncharacterized protein n=1 Tax=Methylocaldum szegediense TaxID=73780 RepID=A0ABM9I416_9GAMM|nr:hypothetical protein [Methylocaldum szegediense]CAI8876577.1 conserved protein of unknown function [Methylocaldum szegediense]